MQCNALHPDIEQAIVLLQQGELVAFPTETVYGLGGLASYPETVQKIFAVKARSSRKPLSLLIPNQTHLAYWARDITLAVQHLAQMFWPGPLTLLLRPTERVLTSISGDSGCVGLRVPSHPVALALLSRLGDALAAPSANISGQLSPTTANSVRQQLGDRISLILEEDSCAVGIESTVIDMTGISPVIRRLGAISVQAIEQALGKVVAVEVEHEALEHDPGFIMKWVENTRTGRTCSELDDQTAILAHSPLSYTPSSSITWISLPSQPIHYQRCVYQQLSQLKHQGYHTVLIERLPLTPEWESMTACLNRWCKSGILAQ